MKFEIDTENKTIKLKEEVKLSVLVQELKDLLDRDWEDYTLIMGEKLEYIYKSIPPSYPPPNIPNTDPNNLPNIYC